VANTTEIVEGDVLNRSSLVAALSGVGTAYYLVHSMGSRGSFEDQDRVAAENFAKAARDAGVRRVVYLGGLGGGTSLSSHLSSRQEVGEILRTAGPQTIEFRASIVIGSGSLSFEMIRSLVERLPVMITPRWVSVRAQPIAIEDVIAYLVAALDFPGDANEIFEIGGTDQVSYRDMMNEYARQRGLRRWMISVPVLTPRLSSLWLGLVTPVYARVGRKLVESLRNETVVQDTRALSAFAGIRPRGMREAIARALQNEDREFAETRWNDALSAPGAPKSWGGVRSGARLVDSRAAHVAVPAGLAFGAILRIGGDTGWYFGDWLWKVRGWLDIFAGGPGLRRGRRDPSHLKPGDTVDFWRVEAVEHNRLLRLSAEMRLPGRAWLQFEVENDSGGSIIRQTAIYDPEGLWGLAYWYALYPIHQVVFAGMLRGIVRAIPLEQHVAA
jgi:uncharacterized protein YbjT (DUF2867 family)